jgi:hypothetical protein
MTTREHAFEILASLKPSPVFLEAYRTPRLPEDLDIYFGCPEEFFLAPETLPAYTEGRLVPILDDGSFDTVTFYDSASGGLVQKSVESPREIVATFANWPQYIVHLMIRIAESVDDDDQLRRMGDLIGFRHFDQLMEFFAVGRNETFEEFQRRKLQFIQSLAP